MQRKSSVLVAAAVAFAISGANLARAETAAVEPAVTGGLEEIVVTAQKRRENLQDTPISVSVLGFKGIEDRQVVSLLDLGDGSIPSLKVAPFYSRPGALIMNVRGIGVLSDSNQPARDQGVGVYIDGVYLGRAQGLGMALYDVESIEVLKGPQGTLFGRNTEGGAVNIVTKKPAGEFKMSALAGTGNYGSNRAEVHLDLPEFANLAVKIDGTNSVRGALVANPLQGASGFGSYDRRGLVVQARWKPSDTFSANYAYDRSRDATTTLYQQLLAPGSLKLAAAATLQVGRADTANVGVPEQPSIGDTTGNRLTLEWVPSDSVTVKSISSYRQLAQGQYDNGSASSTMITTPTGSFSGFSFSRYSLARFDQRQASEELQLIGNTERLKYVAGALYYREHVEDNAQAFATNSFGDAIGSAYTILPVDYAKQRIDRASRVTTTSSGVFGQFTYTPPMAGDALHITAGGRWTKDSKLGELFTINGAVPVVNGVSGPRQLDSSWNRVDPLVTLAYDVTKDFMAYGKWSTGYKSGGANSRSLFYSPFNPETVSMFEAGFKSEFWDHRARFNVAAYTGKYKDIQLDFSAQYQQYDAVTGALLTTLRTTTETTNAPGAGSLKGAEFDLQVAPIDGLTLSASYAYNDVQIPATINPFRQSNGQLITVPIPIYQVYTPKSSASVSMDYDMPFNGMKIVTHLDANYDSGYYANYTDVAYDPVTRAVTVAQPMGDSAIVVNGRLALADIQSSVGKATVSLWARNLLNEEHLFYKSLSPTAGLAGFYNEPRTFGVQVKLEL
jgi:iron complex outermembrane receptor protein